MPIRTATNPDRDDIHSVHWSAFAADERALVSELAVNLLSEQTTPKTISLVAESEGNIVGHVAFSPVTLENDKSFRGYILAPLGVKPDYQQQGIGSTLIESGIQQLSTMDVNILFVYGDPNYYSKFGFSVDAAAVYTPPYELHYPLGWQGLVLNESSTGRSSAKLVCVTSLNNPMLW